MTKRKNFTFVWIIIMCMFILGGCENATMLNCATISEITSAGSENYGVRINFLSDSRIQDKYVDVQIKFDKICQVIFWEENQDKLTLTVDDYDEWYSLTSLIAIAKGQEGKEKFEQFSQASAKTYLFNYDGQLDITFRVVVGEAEDNSTGNGQILVGSEQISSQFTLKIK